jgi:hypothetical protein
MTKLFRDVDFYIVHASNSTQREFELDFADVIEVYDTNSIVLTTEDRRELTINFCEKGYFKSYFVELYVTDKVLSVINTLKEIDVDGETMQFILEKVGMEDQMLKQLIGTADGFSLHHYLNLRQIARNS